MKFRNLIGSTIALILCALGNAQGAELIVNGGFETGTFASWTVTDQLGGSGSFFVSGVGATPFSGHPSVGPATGSFYAVSDQTGPGAHAITQSFVVAAGATSVTLSYDMFVNNYDGPPTAGALTFTAGPTEHARVDLLTAAAAPFDTGAGVITNFYDSADPGGPPHPYTHYVFDITAQTAGGGTFQIRFAESDNQGFFNQGVDNVSIVEVVSDTPEPATLTLLGIGIAGMTGYSWRKRKTLAAA